MRPITEAVIDGQVGKEGSGWASTASQLRQLIVFQYGNALTNNDDYTEFSKAAILPAEVDRAGAPAMSLLDDITERLETRWRPMFKHIPHFGFRYWSNEISQLPTIQHADAIARPPMGHVLAIFDVLTSESDIRRDIRRSHALHTDMIRSGLSALADMESKLNNAEEVARELTSNLSEVPCWVQGHKYVYQALLEAEDAYIRSVAPLANATQREDAARVQDVQDVDHADSEEDDMDMDSDDDPDDQ
jgi:hypothetical protein